MGGSQPAQYLEITALRDLGGEGAYRGAENIPKKKVSFIVITMSLPCFDVNRFYFKLSIGGFGLWFDLCFDLCFDLGFGRAQGGFLPPPHLP